MSKKPEPNEDANAAGEEPQAAEPLVRGSDDQRNDSPDQAERVNDELDAEEFAEEEFSLDQLSQAYAEVLKSRTDGETIETADQSGEDGDSTETEDSETVSFEAGSPEIDNAACPISPESIIESILFVGAPQGVKLNSRKVAAVLRDVSPKEVTKIVRELNEKYEQKDAAYRIKSDGGVFQMILDPKLTDFQQEFFGRNRQVRLSQAAIDVMAIVAYNQPATREQIDKIWAKPSARVLSQLVRRQLLFVEPGETDPKIRYYATTDRFLDLFSLEEIADLPQSHDVSDIEELAD